MKKWERNKVNKITLGLLIGVAVGILLGVVFKNMGLFLPIGGIAGMCVGVIKK